MPPGDSRSSGGGWMTFWVVAFAIVIGLFFTVGITGKHGQRDDKPKPKPSPSASHHPTPSASATKKR